jgi:hypothetical protein
MIYDPLALFVSIAVPSLALIVGFLTFLTYELENAPRHAARRSRRRIAQFRKRQESFRRAMRR